MLYDLHFFYVAWWCTQADEPLTITEPQEAAAAEEQKESTTEEADTTQVHLTLACLHAWLWTLIFDFCLKVMKLRLEATFIAQEMFITFDEIYIWACKNVQC